MQYNIIYNNNNNNNNNNINNNNTLRLELFNLIIN